MLYGRRKGPRLSAHQQSLLDCLLPEFELNLRPNADPRSDFSESAEEVWLEVGFGGGEHLIWQARHNPDIGLIGAEPYVNGVVKLLSHIEALTPTRPLSARDLHLSGRDEEDRVTLSSPCKGEDGPRSGSGGGHWSNIRIYAGDARDILEALPDASLGRVFILFPDPWPKMRHHKRRFIQTAILDELARVMKPGAELRFASDNAGYVEWTLERLMAHEAFAWTATRASDWQTRPDDWPPTRYEAKELHGKPTFLRFVRR
ncbi:MAG: tRNA (guanosine(46)-N7)-methyltransferase TrmB [Alphaproteobacteria bacterium]|nr:tRNA (guanosine(46)-N7)-methyltransferase TrmB [Alphaproteobacteria bacterium]